MKALCFMVLSFKLCFGFCAVVCTPELISESTKSSLKITKEYAKLIASMTQLLANYALYMSAYKQQNKELEKLQNLRMNNSLKLSEILFLLESSNAILEKNIDIKAEQNAQKN